MALNPQEFALAVEGYDRLRKSTEIPIFFGDSKKDNILPSVLIARVERARRSANWTEERTCDEFLNCLREKAIYWHKGFEGVQVNDRNWQEIKEYFLATYEPRFSARTTRTNFQRLRQEHDAKVQEFNNRLSVALEQLRKARPAEMLKVRRVPAPAPQVAPAGADAAATAAVSAHNVTAMTPEQNRAADKLEGWEDAEFFFMYLLFTAGPRDTVDTRMQSGLRSQKRYM